MQPKYVIESVRIDNVRSYQTQQNVIRFSPKLNVIMGNNGAGKTTVLESVVFALTGKSPESVVINQWANTTLPPPFEAGVALELRDMVGGGVVATSRYFAVQQSKTGTSCLKSARSNPTEIGLDPGLAKYCQFCQENNASWMFGTESGLFSIFNELLNTDKYARYADYMRKCKVAEKPNSTLKRELQGAQKQLYNYQRYMEQAKGVRRLVGGILDNEYQTVSRQLEQVKVNTLTPEEVLHLEGCALGDCDRGDTKQLYEEKQQLEKEMARLQGEVARSTELLQRTLRNSGPFGHTQLQNGSSIESIVQELRGIFVEYPHLASDASVQAMLLATTAAVQCIDEKAEFTLFNEKLAGDYNASMQAQESAIYQQLEAEEAKVQQVQRAIEDHRKAEAGLLEQIQVLDNSRQQIQQQHDAVSRAYTNRVEAQARLSEQQLAVLEAERAVSEGQKRYNSLENTVQRIEDDIRMVDQIADQYKSCKGTDVRECAMAISNYFQTSEVGTLQQLLHARLVVLESEFSRQLQKTGIADPTELGLGYDEVDAAVIRYETLLSNLRGIMENKQLLTYIHEGFRGYLDMQNVTEAVASGTMELFSGFINSLTQRDNTSEVATAEKALLFLRFCQAHCGIITTVTGGRQLSLQDAIVKLQLIDKILIGLHPHTDSIAALYTYTTMAAQGEGIRLQRLIDTYAAGRNDIVFVLDDATTVVTSVGEALRHIAESLRHEELSCSTQLENIKQQLQESASKLEGLQQSVQECAERHAQLLSVTQNPTTEGDTEALKRQLLRVQQEINYNRAIVDHHAQRQEELRAELRSVQDKVVDRAVQQNIDSLISCLNASMLSARVEALHGWKASVSDQYDALRVKTSAIQARIDAINMSMLTRTIREKKRRHDSCAVGLQDNFGVLLERINALGLEKTEILQTAQEKQLFKGLTAAKLQAEIDRIYIVLQAVKDRTRDKPMEQHLLQLRQMLKQLQGQFIAQTLNMALNREIDIVTAAIRRNIKEYQVSKLQQINCILQALWGQVYNRNSDLNAIESIQLVLSEKGIAPRVIVKSGSGLKVRPVRTGLSSGQRVLFSIVLRIAFAKAFQSQIATICLDEPTNFLDQANASSLAEILGKFVEDNEIQLIVITHSALFKDMLMNQESRTKVICIQSENCGSRIIDLDDVE